MFHFPGFPLCTYVFSTQSMVLHHRGCPIRRSAAELICSWPQLIAACHVLLRLLMPRHSPCALISLNFFSNSFLFSLSFSKKIAWVSQIIVTVVVTIVLPQCDKIAVFYSRFLERPMFLFSLIFYSIICSFLTHFIQISLNFFFYSIVKFHLPSSASFPYHFTIVWRLSDQV